MPDTPISALPAATSVGLADVIPFVQSAITKKVSQQLLMSTTLFRVYSDGSLQLYNPDQSKWHTIQVRGAAGAEYITIAAGVT